MNLRISEISLILLFASVLILSNCTKKNETQIGYNSLIATNIGKTLNSSTSTILAVDNDIDKSQDSIYLKYYKEFGLILLNGFIRSGVNRENVSSGDTRYKIESIISDYWGADDFDTGTFYENEFKKIENSYSQIEIDLWEHCNAILNFEDVIPLESLESDWRYPINQIISLKKIMDTYKDVEYGDSIYGLTLHFHMSLYLYFTSETERAEIFTEIAKLKEDLKLKYSLQ